jgi:carboxyl-terminal processing protease
VYKTQCGDSVYGGGGITPKFLVGRDTSMYRIEALLYRIGTVNRFIYNYYINHLDEINKFSTPEEFIAKYNNEEGRWQELVSYAAKDSIDLTKIPPEDKYLLQRTMKAQLAKYKWRLEGYYEAVNSFDPVIKKALEVLETKKK